MNGLVLRSAIERARVSWRGIAAAALGAIAACLAVAFASPLSLAGGARVQQAAALFAADLAQYRAAPADLRAAPLVSAAAAGYEDRAFFHRPRWVPPLSPPGIARALVRNLRGIQQGGSTIPQQLAKLYLREGPRGDLLDKGREALFATWLVRQAAPDEIAGVYLNLSAATSMGTARRPAEGLNRLSLALFGLPLRRLAREDQLVLGASPRGVQWLRAHPVLSAHRIAATRDWLVSEKLWDTSVQSYLDGAGIDPEGAFRFVEGWTERVASGELPTADLDLVAAIDQFRDGLQAVLQSGFPGTDVRAAFAALGRGGAVLARSGAESALMAVNYGSVAKLEALDLAVEAFGPEAVRELMLPPGACVRWIWSTKELRRSHPSRYCPTDVAPATRPMALDEAVARSVNSMTTRHAILLPALLAQRRPDLLREVAKELSPQERAALDSPADRALAGDLLAQLGEALPPDSIPPELSYSAAGVALFRYLRDRREQAGLPAERLPEDPTSLLGNSSRATPEQIGAYLQRKLFANDGTCMLSDTGALLALHRKEGTLRWLAQRWPRIVFSGKTGSSPHDDSAVAAVGLCLDARPVVLIGALRPLHPPLPDGLQGSVLLRGIDAYLRELAKLQRKPSSALLPAWAEPPAPAEIAAEATP
ncbi:MAG TPA: transglycosylase domain-containing protein [Myxococcales bacterium]|nr:transglycosylase domain-containing protein [Myxococcales bacterium]